MRNLKAILIVLLCLCGIHVQAQQLEIKGLVTSSEDKQPLIGATVAVKGVPGRGVVTDMDGRYTLKIEPSDKILVISYIGMKSSEVKVPKNGVLNVVLQPESLNLDEVVVTGYGNFSKSSFTGSANTLRADMLKNVPVLSVEQKLQGMTTGVNITSGSVSRELTRAFVSVVWGHSMHPMNRFLYRWYTGHFRQYGSRYGS